MLEQEKVLKGTEQIILYGIAGYTSYWDFKLPHRLRNIGFGGYFKKFVNDSIEGELIDRFGPSHITGFLKPRQFSFNRYYKEAPDDYRSIAVLYSLNKNRRSWMGVYKLHLEAEVFGEIKCRIFLVATNAYEIEIASLI